MRTVILSLFVILLSFSIGHSRPISYADSWTIMQMTNWEKTRVHVHYTTTVTNSFGLVYEDYHGRDRWDVDFQWNHLLSRKNTRFSQANVYAKTQLGVANGVFDAQFNGNFALAADWETRRYFLAYETGLEYADDYDDGSFHQMARVGIAPYVAEYGSLHTWLMLQVEHHPDELDDNRQLIVTPLVRFFIDDYLTEFGVNTNGDLLFNFIIRF